MTISLEYLATFACRDIGFSKKTLLTNPFLHRQAHLIYKIFLDSLLSVIEFWSELHIDRLFSDATNEHHYLHLTLHSTSYN